MSPATQIPDKQFFQWQLVRAAHLRRASTVYTAETQSAGACTSTK